MKIGTTKRTRGRTLILLPLLATSLALPAGPVRADSTSVQTVETHVLPIGQYTLGTITKQGAAALRTVRTRAAEDDGAHVALENVGPAARFAKVERVLPQVAVRRVLRRIVPADLAPGRQAVGESMFNVMAVGTIAENTRQIQFAYHVTERVSTGNTGVTGMQITLDGKIAQSWPRL
ncbi:hypothetical protein AB0M97_26655 [Streptomyces sp. NPDC051207]|uniref:hypothetical protein n=1 Tax=Streptomyces sp. NPDC051207 TaxID=3154641 RepID=UPI003448C16F